MGAISDAVDGAKDCARQEAISDLWYARNALSDVESELIKIRKELEDLEAIRSSYDSASEQFHNSMDARLNNISKLGNLSDRSKSAKTYGGCLSDKLYSQSMEQTVVDFDNVRTYIANQINSREERVEYLNQRKSSLEYQIYNANRTLNELEEDA